ncbi:MAG: isocitrate lyase, partial [Bacteroidota bacterium]
MTTTTTIQQIKTDWATNPRWAGIKRPYTAEEVVKLRGSIAIEHSLARRGAERFWNDLQKKDFVAGLGALTGNQAIQEVAAGLSAIYLSGWQVAADANLAGEMYPDQSLYPANSVPMVVKRINNALLRRDQIQSVSQTGRIDWLVPIIADAEAGFGGNLNAFELMKSLIEAGAAAAHFEDQLSSAKKCGHLGGKVLVPTQEAINKLVAARLAADVCNVPTVLIARTDADAANLLTSDIDPRDQSFVTGERSTEGFFYVKAGLEQGIARGLAYAPYADLIWLETSHPDLDQARTFAEAIHAEYPGKMLAYNCSPSFNWAAKLTEAQMRTFREDIAEMGYKFQFITLAGFHALNTSMFELSQAYRQRG